MTFTLNDAATGATAVQILGGTTKAGEVTVTVSADGKSIARINLTFTDTRSCNHNFDFTNVSVVDGKMFSAGSMTANKNFAPSFAGLTQGRTTLRGALFDTLCPPAVAQWNATLVMSSVVNAPAATAPPAATATPAPSGAPSAAPGTLLTPPVFSAGGQASVVFAGGKSDQLEDTVKGSDASGAWVQDASGTYRLLVAGGPTFVNGPFRDAFTKGIPAFTAVILTR